MKRGRDGKRVTQRVAAAAAAAAATAGGNSHFGGGEDEASDDDGPAHGAAGVGLGSGRPPTAAMLASIKMTVRRLARTRARAQALACARVSREDILSRRRAAPTPPGEAARPAPRLLRSRPPNPPLLARDGRTRTP